MTRRRATGGRLIDSREVARRCGVSLSTVERWRFERSGPPPVRLGPRLVRYRLVDVDAYLEERRGHDDD